MDRGASAEAAPFIGGEEALVRSIAAAATVDEACKRSITGFW